MSALGLYSGFGIFFCGHDQHPDPTQDGTGFDAPSVCWRWSHDDVLSRVCGEDLFRARTSLCGYMLR